MHVQEALSHLNQGTLRIAEKTNGAWQVHAWLKQAILLYFKIQQNQSIDAGYTQFYDKVPLKFQGMDATQMTDQRVRIVPPAVARFGAFIAQNCVLMPSYVNLGAYIDTGCMVDTWATVGSCAQIGKNVHLSGGVGIGGVLEPLQAAPTIIEDDCFIGARSEIVEGVIVEARRCHFHGCVYRPKHQNLPPRDRRNQLWQGTFWRCGGAWQFTSQRWQPQPLYCAVIVKQVDAKTRAKVGINALLRDDS